jgi:predicted MPP superfamily phosphohydrolase
MKTAIFNLYLRLCQYPWYLIFNVGFGGFVYLSSMALGPRLTRIFLKSRSRSRIYPIGYFIMDRLLASVAVTLPAGILALIFIYQNGVAFALFGFNYFFWFFFFPLHLIIHALRHLRSKGRIEISKIVIAALLLSIFYLSTFYFPGHIVVRSFRIEAKQLSAPLRIVHLSDIHCERYGEREARTAAIVNSLEPDLILITGDIFNTPWFYNIRGFNAALRFMPQLHARYGVYAVTGHHDAWGGTEELRGSLGDRIHYLDHDWLRFNDRGLNLTLFGAIQGWHKFYPDTIDTVAGNYRIFFAHSPAWIKDLKTGDFDLALFGHTHAGQINFPFLTSIFLGPYLHGWYRKNGIPVYVNAGIGMDGLLAPRVRWFTFPEIVVIDIIPAPK